VPVRLILLDAPLQVGDVDLQRGVRLDRADIRFAKPEQPCRLPN